MDNNLANVDLLRNGPPDPLLPMCDTSAVPTGHTLEVERLTTLPSRYSWRTIRALVAVDLALIFMLLAVAIHVWLFFADRATLINGIIAAVGAAVSLECLVFCIYVYCMLTREQEFVLEMERNIAGSVSDQRWVETEGDDPWIAPPPVLTEFSILSLWTPRISGVTYQNGNSILTPIGPGTQRDELVEKLRLGPLLFKKPTVSASYEPLTQELDDRLPTELMIPKIHQLGIDPQLLATRVNQAANSIDMSSSGNKNRKDALIASRTRPGAPDPWALTVAFVTADVQNRTRLGDEISAFLLAQ